jgi:hypothetical protein
MVLLYIRQKLKLTAMVSPRTIPGREDIGELIRLLVKRIRKKCIACFKCSNLIRGDTNQGASFKAIYSLADSVN